MVNARVSVVQFDRDSEDPHRNLARMKADIAANAESDLVIFPELALHGHEWVAEHVAEVRQLRAVTSEMMREIDEAAASSGTNVIYGAVIEREGRLYNVATFTNGIERVTYDKTHVHWSEGFAPGDSFPVVRSFLRPLGMLICFDAAFAEVPRALALRGAEIVVNISAIPADFPIEHVHKRLVACSVQNQVYTIFANRAGAGFLGGSAVVDPQGNMVATAQERGTLKVEIDLDEVRRWREKEPLFEHRRPALYRDLAQ